MKKIFIILTVFLAFGCDSYLDLVPEKDILSEDILFEKRANALQYLNTAFSAIVPKIGSDMFDPAMLGADEFVSNDHLRDKNVGNTYRPALNIMDGLRHPSDPILGLWDNNCGTYMANYYEAIRYCNTFIKRVDEVCDMESDEKVFFKYQAKALKGFLYFELVKQYGPIVLVPENLPVSASIEEIRTPRQPIDTCFKEIVGLFDEALIRLPLSEQISNTKRCYLSKEAIAALKAKALLYAASPLFNGCSWFSGLKNVDGKELFPQSYDETKWQKAGIAIDQAISLCEQSGKFLYKEEDENKTNLINTIQSIKGSLMQIDANGRESVWSYWANEKVYANIYGRGLTRLPRCIITDEDFNNDIKGCVNPSLRMVELFYTKNGLPINEDLEWNYDQRYNLGIETDAKYDNVVLLNAKNINLHLKREPRFYADIAAPYCKWKKDQDYITMQPMKGEKHGTNLDQISFKNPMNLTGYWCKKGVPDDAYSDSYSYKSGTFYPWPIIRLAELYLMQAEIWNEIQGPSTKVYDAINKVRERAGIPTVQESWQHHSKNPNKINDKFGMREIIRQEILIEFAFEGHRFWDLRRWGTAHIEQNKPLKGWNVIGEDLKTFYNNYQGGVVVWNKNKFTFPRDYFWPINDAEIIKAGINQNKNW